MSDQQIIEATVLPPGVQPAEGVVVAEPKGKRKAPAKKKAGSGPGLVVPEEQVTELEALRAELAQDLAHIQRFPLETQEHVDQLTAVGLEAKRRREDLEERRKKITGPLDAAKAEVKRYFDPPIEFLKSAQAAIKSLLEARMNDQRATQAKALAAVQASAGHVDGATMALATGAAHVKPAEGSYEREVWSYEITDLTQLPAQFWTPNLDMLAKYATEHKGEAEKGAAQVPGVRFFATRSLVMREGK